MSRDPGALYDAAYFATGCGRPYQRDAEWLAFFGGIAERIVRDLAPARVLDAGCALGLLVEELRARGVDAWGIDVSRYAIENAHEAVRPYCSVASVTVPLAATYDLIVCIEVLEHLTPAEAEQALDVFATASGQVLFSSTPYDYAEASHANVRPPSYWAEAFARRGLVRDLEFDASFVTPWAALFARSAAPLPRVVAAYERRLWELQQEVEARRALALEQRAVRTTGGMPDGVPADDRDALRAERDALLAERQRVAASPGGRVLATLQRTRALTAPEGSRRDAALRRLFGSP